MQITSFHFLLFTLGILVVYHLLPHRARNIWLLIASYVFYISWSWEFALLLLAATIFHFELAKRLRKDGHGQSTLLWLGVGTNIVLFMVFKTSNFYFHRLIAFLEQMGVHSGLSGLQIVMPLGLSYYVLQNISYLVDVYRGQIPATTRFVDFSLYLAYFPKLVAGPIERARVFLPMLVTPRRVDNQAFVRSLILIFVGLTRKLLFANVLFAHLPWQDLMTNPGIFSKMELICWLMVYSFGLYNDFAGYTSIVRGVSGLFGIELSPNFNTPYFSRSFTEFWNRWHITLSHWLRDYIFFPINRMLARCSTTRNAWQTLVIPPIITMMVSGFWHGPNWQMLLWGGIHGLYLVIERLLTLKQDSRRENRGTNLQVSLSNLVVFLLVALAWVPFAMRIPNTLEILQQLWVGDFFSPLSSRLIFPLVMLIPAVWLDWVQHNELEETFFLRQKRVVQAAMLATVIIFILVITSSSAGQPFIYQGF